MLQRADERNNLGTVKVMCINCQRKTQGAVRRFLVGSSAFASGEGMRRKMPRPSNLGLGARAALRARGRGSTIRFSASEWAGSLLYPMVPWSIAVMRFRKHRRSRALYHQILTR